MRVDKSKTGILWFRKDLRLRDNESLCDILNSCNNVIPIYIFDERFYDSKSENSIPKTRNPRLKFLIESVIQLKNNLREKGSDLLIRYGNTSEILYELCKENKVSWIYCNRERTGDELKIQDETEEKVWSIGVEIRYNRGKMLYYTADLPFPITHAPDSFANFRKEVENIIEIRKPLSAPSTIPSHLTYVELGAIPDILIKRVEKFKNKLFIGGENQAIDRLTDYKRTPLDFESSYLSPYLANGCISPKSIFHELAEGKRTYHKIGSQYKRTLLHLLERDYLRLMAKKYKSEFFRLGGLNQEEQEYVDNPDAHIAWINGETDCPTINKLMHKLNETGFLSFQERKFVAQYYIYDLKLPWTRGAHYFEEILIDNDSASNYGNWRYIANVSPDKVSYKLATIEQLQID